MGPGNTHARGDKLFGGSICVENLLRPTRENEAEISDAASIFRVFVPFGRDLAYTCIVFIGCVGKPQAKNIAIHVILFGLILAHPFRI